MSSTRNDAVICASQVTFISIFIHVPIVNPLLARSVDTLASSTLENTNLVPMSSFGPSAAIAISPASVPPASICSANGAGRA